MGLVQLTERVHVIPENVHTVTPLWRVLVNCKPNFLKKIAGQNWSFQREGWQNQNLTMQGVQILSGTTSIRSNLG